MRREIVELRQGEPWFADAAAAFERIAGRRGAEADWAAMAPFFYGRWDAAAQAHDAAEAEQTNEDAAEAFGADGGVRPGRHPRGPGRPRLAGAGRSAAASTCNGRRR